MKLITRLLMCFAVCIFSFSSSEAQIFDKISQSLDKAISSEMGKIGDKMAERLAEKFIEKIFTGQQAETDSLDQYQASDTATSNVNQSVDFSSLFGSSKKVDKQYNFDFKVDVRVSSADNSNEISYYFPKEGLYTCYDMNSILMVIDYETGESYTVINDKLSSFNMQKIIEKYTVTQVGDNEEFTITKTGNKETIAGYLCEEYLLETSETTISSFITKDFIKTDFASAEMLRKLSKVKEGDQETVDGFSMRTVVTSKKDASVTTIEIVKVTDEKKIVDLSQY